MIDEKGNKTIKCSRYYKDWENIKVCIHKNTVICPLISLSTTGRVIELDNKKCKNGTVILEWMEYIKFNNYNDMLG